MWDSTSDVLVLGAGHNSLIAAAYLAKAGVKTLVLEAKSIVGGGCTSEELTKPGFVHDVCATIHGGIVSGPVPAELELERYGLNYMFPDPMSASIFPDGSSIVTYRDVERTAREIEKLSPRDGVAYRRLVGFWEEHVKPWFIPVRYSPPKQPSELYGLIEQKGAAGQEVMRLMASSPLEVVNEFFEDDRVRAHVLKASLQGGPLLDQFGYGLLVLTNGSGMRHSFGWAFPEGGSQQLPDALTRAIEEHGGQVLANARVREIIVKDGEAVGVETDDGRRFRASQAIVAGLHVRQLFLDMIDDRWLDPSLVEMARQVRSGLSEVILHIAMKEKPRFRGNLPEDVVLCQVPESMPDLAAAYANYRTGHLYPRAPFQVVAHTLIDSKRAPAGGHVLNIGHYAPYALEGDPNTWRQQKDEIFQHEMQRVQEYIPNLSEDTVGSAMFTPVEIEAHNPMFYRGDIMGMGHVLSQEGILRPHPAIADYRMPVKKLYLTAACAYPGGSISGAPGRNAAMTVLQDLGVAAGAAR
ncbi:MAG TPA: NAD(P)/FAD-dependent oxidoreductase [Dehalococcoidia bacterium]|nr:NAD(P)/FAD-dependent oxidoreductase [Dehalococcoidia bacterium]